MPFQIIREELDDFRKYRQIPIQTITIACFFASKDPLLRRKDKILLLQRSSNPYAILGYKDPQARFWELIGGYVREIDGGNPLKAAQREALEETALEMIAIKLFGISPFIHKGTEGINWIYFCITHVEQQIKISVEHEASSWALIEDALQLPLAFKHSPILRTLCLVKGDQQLQAFVSSLV